MTARDRCTYGSTGRRADATGSLANVGPAIFHREALVDNDPEGPVLCDKLQVYLTENIGRGNSRRSPGDGLGYQNAAICDEFGLHWMGFSVHFELVLIGSAWWKCIHFLSLT